jgi:hypothetical protein
VPNEGAEAKEIAEVFATTEETELAEKKTNFVSAYSATSVVKNLSYL